MSGSPSVRFTYRTTSKPSPSGSSWRLMNPSRTWNGRPAVQIPDPSFGSSGCIQCASRGNRGCRTRRGSPAGLGWARRRSTPTAMVRCHRHQAAPERNQEARSHCSGRAGAAGPPGDGVGAGVSAGVRSGVGAAVCAPRTTVDSDSSSPPRPRSAMPTTTVRALTPRRTARRPDAPRNGTSTSEGPRGSCGGPFACDIAALALWPWRPRTVPGNGRHMRTRSHGTRASRDGPDEVGRAPRCRLMTRRLAKMEQTGWIPPQTGQSGQTTATPKVDRCSETSWFGRRGGISMPSRH